MRFSLILENQAGERIRMTNTANQYMISNIDGLYPPAGTVSTTPYAGMDGSYFHNAFIEKRNLVLYFSMRGTEIELHRQALYRVVKTGRYIKVYYQTVGIDVYTEGYVENCIVKNFGEPTNGQISIICPDPYWYSTKSIYATSQMITGAFHFPFPESDDPFPLGQYNTDKAVTIFNSGEEVGFTILLEAETGENVPNPAVRSPVVYDVDTDAYLQLNMDMQPGDKITITTKQGAKSIQLTRNGITSNIMNCLSAGSTWLMLREGRSRFALRASGYTSYLTATFIHTDAFLGV